ncbi:MAG: Asp-tRNA(Asn)/Glu-tRNA(Gln) amidotransferase subunit GatC [Bacteroidota bacterium]
MKIDHDTLHKMAHLSRLEINPKDEEKILKEMSAIVTFVEKLNEVNTDGVGPLTTMSQEVNALREDVVKPHMPHSDALKNAPQKDNDFFRVPKVLE